MQKFEQNFNISQLFQPACLVSKDTSNWAFPIQSCSKDCCCGRASYVQSPHELHELVSWKCGRPLHMFHAAHESVEPAQRLAMLAAF